MNISQLKNLIASIQKLILSLRELLKKKEQIEKEEKKEEETENKKDYYAFCLAMRMKESSNRYQVVNSLGYLGAYQFGMARLCDLGYTERKAGTTGFSNDSFVWKKGYSKKIFLENPNFQDKVFGEHVSNLLRYIDRDHKVYFGTERKGILITRSGCVAFAHLAGLAGLNRFLLSGFDPKDIVSGISATSYMRHFAGYDLSKVG